MSADKTVTIGVVETSRVLAESTSGKHVGKELQTRGAGWQERMAVAEQQRDQDQDNLQKNAAKMGPKERFRLELKLRMGSEQLAQMQKLAQLELEAYSEYYQAMLSQTLAGVLDALGKEKEFALILTGPSAQMPFVGRSVDITDEAIKRFDAAFKPDQI